ncbi:ATP-dependent helicase [Brevibacillus laterosporus]|uniref:UvrD-helicase domain-containing protein n=1 Tax=Brevibacillus laterosporus TaxID=1465 RepID=UPI000C764058|nr:ATP-dependent helicase [Brevibacillus laterosporus]AUM63891.1 ATP-dependent helicase [Brevibacillus laterosporus]MDF9413153.1 ATP-dependent helicase [Brevibacillus laterosporus]
MTKYLNKNLWEPVDGMVLEPIARTVVRSHLNSVIIAGPGAGKTELLAQRACYLLQTGLCKEPQKILAISLKVDAADNLRERVEKRCGTELSKRFESRTFDSFSKSLVDRFRLSIDMEYRPKKDYDIIFTTKEVREIAVGFLTENHPTNPNWQHSINFDVLFKHLAIDSLPFSEDDTDIYNWIRRRLWHILIYGNNTLKSSITFPMISRLAEYIIRNNFALKKALQSTYSHVFLDEFQDTTYHQYDLLKIAFKDSDSILTAVGDDKQRIMGWANAMDNSFGQFLVDFKAVEYHLSLNHRSAPKLVEIQNVLANSMRQGATNVTSSDKWGDQDGICQVWNFPNHFIEAEHIALEISKKIHGKNIRPRDICILVKQQEHIYAKVLMRKLETLNINSRIEKEYQDLLGEECIEIINDFIMLISSEQSPNSWQRVMDLMIYLNGFDPAVDLEELVKLEEHLQSFINEMKPAVEVKHLEEVQALALASTLFQSILKFVGMDKIRSAYPKYLRDSYFKEIIDNGVQKLSESYMKRFNWYEAVLEFLGEYSIPIMTIHKSKGLEYHTVFFLGLEDDAFWSFKTQEDADLCAFFVALSRAKQEVFFTFSNSREIMRFRELKTIEQFNVNISSLYQLLSNAQVPIISFS